MSPLACSLLALAALLAVATALTNPDRYCGELNLGIKTNNPRYFTMKARDGIHTIPDHCAPGGTLGTERVGQYIFACNPPNSKPEITQIFGTDFDKVSVECPNNTYGCEKLVLHVTQYCDVVGPQKPRVLG